MALNFCSTYGNILDISTNETVKCDACREVNPNTTRFQTTTSTTDNFPSLLRTKLHSHMQVITPKDMENTRRIQRECPSCKAKEMTWSGVQLRSADEGTTIFYRCSSCGYRSKEEN